MNTDQHRSESSVFICVHPWFPHRRVRIKGDTTLYFRHKIKGRVPFNSGFSLIEVLVVIGIIAILIGLLLPSLRVAREQAKTVQCLSQLRQIGYAIHQYAIANQGKLPAWGVRHEYPNDPYPPTDFAGLWTGPGWPILIERHLGQKPDGPVWNCPAFPDTTRRMNYFLGAKWMRVQKPILRTIPITKIRNSTTYILSGDCTAQEYYPPPFGIDDASPYEDIDKDDGGIKCLRFFGEDGGFNMHRIGNNVLFADNHAATFRKFEPGQLTYSPTGQADWENVKAE